jgi:phosphatidylglycerol:prolipoprotein diacylglycerol transferase
VTFPYWIGVGSWHVHPHLVFELLADAVAAWAYWHQRRTRGDHLSVQDRWALAAAAVAGAVVGSRLLFWFEDPQRTIALLRDVQYLVGGQTIVGALIGGWLAVEWQKRRLGIQEPTGDLFALPIALGVAVGRIGCFLSGLPDGTYGLPTSLPWGVDLGDGLARHPTALYESLFMFGLAWWLSQRRSKPHVSPAAARAAAAVPAGVVLGEVFLSLMAAYFAFRLMVDFLKPGFPSVVGLTAIQWAAAAGLAACVLIWRRHRQLARSQSAKSG